MPHLRKRDGWGDGERKVAVTMASAQEEKVACASDLCDATDGLSILFDDDSSLADPDTYRRARRQDYLLQTADHRVLHVLSADDSARFPAILDDILKLVLGPFHENPQNLC